MQSETVPTSAPPAPPPQRSLVRKLAEIMGEVARVPKSGRNEFHRYDYATEADIADAVRQGLAKRSVMIMPTVQKTEWTELPTKSGRADKLCTLTVKFTIEDGESGEVREMVVIGQGSDAGDKASYKAMTGAEKYALLKLFLISTGDDPERDEQKPSPPLQKQVAPRPPAPQQAPPRSTTPPPAAGPAPSASPPPPATPPAGKDPATAAFNEANRETCAKTGHEYDLKTGVCDGCGAQMPKPSPQSKQSPELRARAVKVWKGAQAQGLSIEAFQAWVGGVVGPGKSNSSDWTDEDMGRLEAAGFGPPAAEPGSAG